MEIRLPAHFLWLDGCYWAELQEREKSAPAFAPAQSSNSQEKLLRSGNFFMDKPPHSSYPRGYVGPVGGHHQVVSAAKNISRGSTGTSAWFFLAINVGSTQRPYPAAEASILGVQAGTLKLRPASADLIQIVQAAHENKVIDISREGMVLRSSRERIGGASARYDLGP